MIKHNTKAPHLTLITLKFNSETCERMANGDSTNIPIDKKSKAYTLLLKHKDFDEYWEEAPEFLGKLVDKMQQALKEIAEEYNVRNR